MLQLKRTRVRRENQAIIKGLISATLIFVMGFGAMWTFWIYESNNYFGEFGFFYWRAATWGDGLCLSLLVGSLVAYKSLLGEINRKCMAISYVVGGICGSLAIYIQATWIISDSTNLNWTIPEIHKFMPSGWYHAAFFVFMFFIISALLVQVFLARRVNTRCDKPIYLLLMSVIWFSGLSYVYMHNIDDYYEEGNYMTLTFFTLICFALFSILYCLLSTKKNRTKRTIRFDLTCIFLGCAGALGFGLLVYKGAEDYVTPIICALVSIAFVYPNSEDITTVIVSILLISPPVFFIIAIVDSMNLFFSIIFTVIAISVPFVGYKYQFQTIGTKGIWTYGVTAGIALIFVSVSKLISQFLTVSDMATGAIICDFISSLVVGFTVKINIKTIFSRIQEVEKKKEKDPGTANSRALEKATIVSYFIIMCVSLGIFIFVLRNILAVCKYTKFVPIQLNDSFNLLPIVFLGLLTASCMLIWFLGNRKIEFKKRTTTKVITILLGILTYAFMFVTFIEFEMPCFVNETSLFNIIPAISLIGVSLFISTGFYSNLIKIPVADTDKECFAAFPKVLSIIIFCGSLSCLLTAFCFSNYKGIVFPTFDHMIICMITMLLSSVIIPALLARVIIRPIRKQYQSGRATPFSGIVHDGVLIFFVSIVGVLSPLFISGLITGEGLLTLVTAIQIIILLYFPLTFSFENNAKQMKDKIKEHGNDPDKQISFREVSYASSFFSTSSTRCSCTRTRLSSTAAPRSRSYTRVNIWN